MVISLSSILWAGNQVITEKSLTIPPFEESTLILVQDNSLVAVAVPYYPKTYTLVSLIAEDDLKYYIKSKYPGMADLLLDLSYCEARWKHDGEWGDNYQSYGAFQFQQRTFYTFCQGDWKNYQDQADCAVKMISIGLGPTTRGWFNCYKIQNLFKYEAT